MPSIKPILEPAQVQDLIRQHFPTPLEHLTPIEQGEVARTFAFSTGGEEYILRFQNDNLLAHFPKETLIADRYTSPRLPIPPILHLGRLPGPNGSLHYAISPRLPGRSVDQLPPAEMVQTLPALVNTLAAIHQSDVSQTQGYGVFDDQGIGQFASWHEFIAAAMDEEDAAGFFGKWHTLFDTSFLERPLFERIYAHMLHLLEHAPEARYLVHGDFGFSNVLAEPGRITGVLDWVNALYGDFVYDLARMDFWLGSDRFSQRCYAHYSSLDFPLDHFAERRLCYLCYNSLNALRYYAKLDQEPQYRWTRDRILSELGQP